MAIKTKGAKKKLVSFRTSAEIHRALRIRAAQESKTIESVASDAIVKYLGVSA